MYRPSRPLGQREVAQIVGASWYWGKTCAKCGSTKRNTQTGRCFESPHGKKAKRRHCRFGVGE